MYEEGDKIFYPNHGVGVIMAIETKKILDNKKQYYIIKLPIAKIKIMVPVEKVDEIGIREVIDSKEAENIILLLKDEKSEMSENWRSRYRENMEKVKTGDAFEVAEVVRNLSLRDREKGLAMTEKKMLSDTKQTLISELMLVNNKDEKESENMIEKIFDNNDD